jgi:integrase
MANPRFPGVEVRHARSCPAKGWQRCSCKPSYRGVVYSKADKRRIQSSRFSTPQEATRWRQDAQVDLRRGVRRAVAPVTVRQFAEEWLEGAKSGTNRTRSGRPYKPSALRSYEQALTERILPDLGAIKFGELDRNDVQDLADRLQAKGLSASTVRNAIVPLRAICRRAVARRQIQVNPTAGLELPAVEGRRDRFATPKEAEVLIATVPEQDRVLWATAMYAGLRRGELRAMRWEDVDLAAGVIRVERSWDRVVGEIETKSTAGRRKVPIAAVLRSHLLAHRLKTGGAVGTRVFAADDNRAFDPSTVSARAVKVWKERKCTPITLHECRHTFASLMIAAGVNAKALQTFMGHSSITVTLDRYGHLMPGSEEEAADMLDAYLERARAAVVPDDRVVTR